MCVLRQHIYLSCLSFPLPAVSAAAAWYTGDRGIYVFSITSTRLTPPCPFISFSSRATKFKLKLWGSGAPAPTVRTMGRDGFRAPKPLSHEHGSPVPSVWSQRVLFLLRAYSQTQTEDRWTGKGGKPPHIHNCSILLGCAQCGGRGHRGGENHA